MTSAAIWRRREERAEREGEAAFASGATCPYKSKNLSSRWLHGYNKAKLAKEKS